MSRNKLTLPLGILIAVAVTAGVYFAAVQASNGSDIEDTAVTEHVDLDQIKEQAIRDLYDQEGDFVGPDQRLAQVAVEYPGFGGYYLSEDRETAYVYLLDSTDQNKAQAAFEASYRGQHSPSNVVAVQGDFAFGQLVEWYAILNSALWVREIEVSTSSVREIENRIQYSLWDATDVDYVREIIAELEIPAGAVELSAGRGERL